MGVDASRPLQQDQERRRSPAEDAYFDAFALSMRWSEEQQTGPLNQDARLLEEEDRAMAGYVEMMHRGRLRDPTKVRPSHSMPKMVSLELTQLPRSIRHPVHPGPPHSPPDSWPTSSASGPSGAATTGGPTRPCPSSASLWPSSAPLEDGGDGAANLANRLSALGDRLSALGMLDEAEAVLRESLGLFADLGRVAPSAMDPYVLLALRNDRLEARVAMVDVLLEAGKLDEALGQARLAEAELRERVRVDRGDIWSGDRDRLLMVIATAFMAAGRREKVKDLMHEVFQTFKRQGLEHCHVQTKVLYGVLSAELAFLEDDPSKAPAEVERLLGWLLRSYEFVVEEGLMASSFGARKYPRLLQLLARAKRALGDEAAARRLQGEVAELEALAEALSRAALVELRAEFQEERAAGDGDGDGDGGDRGGDDWGGGGGGGGAGQRAQRTRLTRKQQKRKAAQRRKAEAQAAAAAAAAAAQAAAEGQQKHEQEVEQQGQEEAMAAAAAQLHIHEPEPEECAICTDDLPLPGEEGATLLVCSHTFHTRCLGRWKDKCLEKGLRFTCPMCRALIMVVESA